MQQRMFELHGAVSRVQVHQQGANFSDGELGDYPLGVIGRPQADPVALLHAEEQKSPRSALDLAQEFAISVGLVLVARDERRAIRVECHGAIQHLTDAHCHKGCAADSMAVAQLFHTSLLIPHSCPRS